MKFINYKLLPWIAKLAQGQSKNTYSDTQRGSQQLPKVLLPRASMQSVTKWRYDDNPTQEVDKANKYLIYQYKRLAKAKKEGNARLYWTIGTALVKRSLAFKLAHYHRSVTGWYYKYPIRGVLKHLRQIGQQPQMLVPTPGEEACPSYGKPYLANLDIAAMDSPSFYQSKLWVKATKLKFNRFFILKKNGKLRPIGAPETPDKVTLAMMAWLLTHWVDGTLRKQHGFMPNKGIHTAWQAILENVIDKKNIYEFDLTKAFNRIQLKTAEAALRDKGVPYEVVKTLIGYNLNKPTPPRSDDPEIIGGEEYKKREYTGYKEIDEWIWLISKLIVDLLPNKLIPKWWVPYMGERVKVAPTKGLDKMDPELWDIYYPGTTGHMEGPEWQLETPNPDLYGFTQGSPLSPILAAITLDYLCIQPIQLDGVQYADDGLWASDSLEEFEPDQDAPYPVYWELKKGRRGLIHQTRDERIPGVVFNQSKSGWVRYKGEWLKPLKFLGLTLEQTGLEWTVRDETGQNIHSVASLRTNPKLFGTFFTEKYLGEKRWDWEVDRRSFLYKMISEDKAWLHWLGRKWWGDVVTISDMSTVITNRLIKSLRANNKVAYLRRLEDNLTVSPKWRWNMEERTLVWLFTEYWNPIQETKEETISIRHPKLWDLAQVILGWMMAGVAAIIIKYPHIIYGVLWTDIWLGIVFIIWTAKLKLSAILIGNEPKYKPKEQGLQARERELKEQLNSTTDYDRRDTPMTEEEWKSHVKGRP